MDPWDLLLELFCLVDDELQALGRGGLRARGSARRLPARAVLTSELVGELWKIDTDPDKDRHFRRCHTAEFPTLTHVLRTLIAGLVVSLWRLKQLLHERLARWLAGDDPMLLVDSLPIDTGPLARASFCGWFAGQTDYGYCQRTGQRRDRKGL